MWRRGWGIPKRPQGPATPSFPCTHLLLSPSTPLSLCSYYKGIRQMVQVSDQDMNTHLAEISRVRATELKSKGACAIAHC
jgi:hypothetical protein